jgi:hypothetical protein
VFLFAVWTDIGDFKACNYALYMYLEKTSNSWPPTNSYPTHSQILALTLCSHIGGTRSSSFSSLLNNLGSCFTCCYNSSVLCWTLFALVCTHARVVVLSSNARNTHTIFNNCNISFFYCLVQIWLCFNCSANSSWFMLLNQISMTIAIFESILHNDLKSKSMFLSFLYEVCSYILETQ